MLSTWGGRVERIGRTSVVPLVLVLSIMSLVAAGCAPNTMVSVGSTTPVVTAIPSGTADSRVLAAVHTYEAFNRTLVEAQQHPVAFGRAYPPETDFSRYSFDPLRSEHEAAIAELSTAGEAYRGKPPTSEILVMSINLNATPSPVIVLSDCRVSPGSWRAYDISTNKPVPTPEPKTLTPQGITVTVIYYHMRWGVQTIETDRSRACSAK